MFNYADIINPVLQLSDDQYYMWVNGSAQLANVTYVDDEDNEKFYYLDYIVFHAKAEHKIDGDRGDVEMQFVHRNPEDETDILIAAFICDKSTDEGNFFFLELNPRTSNMNERRNILSIKT